MEKIGKLTKKIEGGGQPETVSLNRPDGTLFCGSMLHSEADEVIKWQVFYDSEHLDLLNLCRELKYALIITTGQMYTPCNEACNCETCNVLKKADAMLGDQKDESVIEPELDEKPNQCIIGDLEIGEKFEWQNEKFCCQAEDILDKGRLICRNSNGAYASFSANTQCHRLPKEVK